MKDSPATQERVSPQAVWRPVPEVTWQVLRSYLGGPAAWAESSPEDLAEAARRGGVSALLGPRLPASPALQAAIGAAVRDGALIAAVEEKIAGYCQRAGVERVVLLKGGATAHQVYQEPWLRQRRDVDLLLSVTDRVRLRDVMMSEGWSFRRSEAWWAREEEPYEEVLYRREAGVEVECDLHVRLSPWRHLQVDHRGMIARAQTLQHTALAVCDPHDGLIHACAHAATSGFVVPLRSWLDVARLCALPEFEWRLVAQRAQAWGLGPSVWVGLLLVRRWFGAPVPDDILRRLRPPVGTARILRWLLSGSGEHPLRVARVGARTKRALARVLALGGLSAMWSMARQRWQG